MTMNNMKSWFLFDRTHFGPYLEQFKWKAENKLKTPKSSL